VPSRFRPCQQSAIGWGERPARRRRTGHRGRGCGVDGPDPRIRQRVETRGLNPLPPAVPEPRQAREGAAVRVRGSAGDSPDRSRGTVGGAGSARRTGAGWPFYFSNPRNFFRFLSVPVLDFAPHRPCPSDSIAGRDAPETEAIWIIDDCLRVWTSKSFVLRGLFLFVMAYLLLSAQRV